MTRLLPILLAVFLGGCSHEEPKRFARWGSANIEGNMCRQIIYADNSRGNLFAFPTQDAFGSGWGEPYGYWVSQKTGLLLYLTPEGDDVDFRPIPKEYADPVGNQ